MVGQPYMLDPAVEAMPRGGEIHVGARNIGPTGTPEKERPVGRKHCVLLSVRDTGQGMTPETLKRIFDPFEQVNGSEGRQHKGTGLGLSLTKKLVELHGGRIWAESAGEGKGSRFRFTLPLLAN